jgi:hypothetical protein
MTGPRLDEKPYPDAAAGSVDAHRRAEARKHIAPALGKTLCFLMVELFEAT